jgi:hypothetical protein
MVEQGVKNIVGIMPRTTSESLENPFVQRLGFDKFQLGATDRKVSVSNITADGYSSSYK